MCSDQVLCETNETTERHNKDRDTEGWFPRVVGKSCAMKLTLAGRMWSTCKKPLSRTWPLASVVGGRGARGHRRTWGFCGGLVRTMVPCGLNKSSPYYEQKSERQFTY